MKITVDVDCTPGEARAFLGLPDVKPLQETMLKEMESRLRATLEAMQPETMLKAWFPDASSLEQWRQMFFSQMAQSGQRDK